MIERGGSMLSGQALQQAFVASRRFLLGRWRDAFTRNAADELAQQAVVEAWRRAATLRDLRCLNAFVRTIVRRRRWRGLRWHVRERADSIERNPDLAELLVAPQESCETFAIGGRRISKRWLLGHVDGAIARLSALNGRLLLDHCEGFSCAELADRHGLSEEAVKVRLHRSRRRVRGELESRIERDPRAASACCAAAITECPACRKAAM
jgi:DNA-directed RNA polymerase specialized sigma24 family protein